MYNMYKYTLKELFAMKKIAVIQNYTKDTEYVYTKRLCDFLNGKAQVLMQEKSRRDGIVAEFVEGDVFKGCDAAIVLGGDGTMIRVAGPCSENAIPVMGINLGKVGFLTEVEKQSNSAGTEKCFSKHCWISLDVQMPRFLFYLDLFRSVRWIIDLSGIVKTMKLLGENIGENPSDLE